MIEIPPPSPIVTAPCLVATPLGALEADKREPLAGSWSDQADAR
jgi:hypothetical protein